MALTEEQKREIERQVAEDHARVREALQKINDDLRKPLEEK